MENLYCTIFIVDVSQNPEEVETVTSRITQLIEDHGGIIKKHNPWGKRRLAYPIENKTSGFYVEIEFTAQSRLNIPQIIEKEYRLNDRVMRYLTYVVTKAELRQRRLSARRAKSEGASENVRPGSANASKSAADKTPKREVKAQASSPRPVAKEPAATTAEPDTQASSEVAGSEKAALETPVTDASSEVAVDEKSSIETPEADTAVVEESADSGQIEETTEKEEVKDA